MMFEADGNAIPWLEAYTAFPKLIKFNGYDEDIAVQSKWTGIGAAE